jgi:hypothetical protein
MKPALSQTVRVVALTFAAGVILRAQDTPVPSDVKAFAAQYVAAYNSKDPSRLLSLYSPESRACVTPANKDVYDAIASLDRHDHVSSGYLLSLTPVNESNLKAMAFNMYFVVKPERELHIDYQYPNTNDGGQLILYLVRRNGRWLSDFPCMTEQGLQSFRENAAARKHYVDLAAAIKEPLRSQLIAMLRQHQLGEASERYQKATGSDVYTAMRVVYALQDAVY